MSPQRDPFNKIRHHFAKNEDAPYFKFPDHGQISENLITPRNIGFDAHSKKQTPLIDNRNRLNENQPSRVLFQYVIKGKATVITAEGEFAQPHGHAALMVIPSASAYRNPVGLDAEWCFLSCTGKIAHNIGSEILKHTPPVFPISLDSIPITSLIKLLLPQIEYSPSNIYERSATAYRFFMGLADLLINPLPKPSSLETRVFEFIERNYQRPELSVDMIAQSLGVSKFHLCRQFKKQSGYSILNRITENRMQLARDLLLYSGMPIKQIASNCGYAQYNYFFTAFKKHFGHSPKKIRP